MKREGFWRYATPPVNIQGVPLPFTMIYLFICPFPSKTTFWICTGIILFFVILGVRLENGKYPTLRLFFVRFDIDIA